MGQAGKTPDPEHVKISIEFILYPFHSVHE
jgi:hypothetical protein